MLINRDNRWNIITVLIKIKPCWTGTTRNKEDRKFPQHQIFLCREKVHRRKQDRVCLEHFVATYVSVFSWCLHLFESHEGTKIWVFSPCSCFGFPSLLRDGRKRAWERIVMNKVEWGLWWQWIESNLKNWFVCFFNFFLVNAYGLVF